MTPMMYLRIGLALAIFAGGFTSAWWIQGKRADGIKAENVKLKDANVSNMETITSLNAEVAKVNQTCEARLKSKDTVIKRLKVIDGLTSKPKSTGDKDEKTSDTGDPLRDALCGMWRDVR